MTSEDMTSEEQKAINVTGFEKALAATSTNAFARIPLTDTFSLTIIDPSPGEWYFGAACKACKRAAPAVKDETNGQRGNPFTGSGRLRFPCHHCKAEILAASGAIFPFQWA